MLICEFGLIEDAEAALDTMKDKVLKTVPKRVMIKSARTKRAYSLN